MAGLSWIPYQSHKRVTAARIISLSGNTLAVSAGDLIEQFEAPSGMFSRYLPVPGDYVVMYDDGYMAVSPKAAFEGGYEQIGNGAGNATEHSLHRIAEALDRLSKPEGLLHLIVSLKPEIEKL